MAEKINRLAQMQVKHAQPPKGRRAILIADGGNLYLQASAGKNGSVNRSWLFRYELDGKRHDMGLGPTFTLPLHAARERALELRQQIKLGIDPLDARKEAKKARLANRAQQAKAATFKQCFEDFYRRHSKSWKNAKHRAQWRSTLETYAYPVIGDLNVADIDTGHVQKVLAPIWDKVPETATRVQKRIEKVLDFAKARDLRTGDNPARWLGHIKTLFGVAQKDVEHHPALPFVEGPAFMLALRDRDSTSARALEFTILTAARTAETIGARWDEIDLKGRQWVIPAGRMKGGVEHRVPLSDRVIEVLKGLPHRGPYVFASITGKPLSNMAMLKFLQGGRPDLTVHGFRSTFRDWAEERTAFPEFVVEMALAHVVGDDVVKAYRRTNVFARRTRLMQQWADFLAKPAPTGATVVPLRKLADA
jgi:integrase